MIKHGEDISHSMSLVIEAEDQLAWDEAVADARGQQVNLWEEVYTG